MQRRDLIRCLKTEREAELAELWARADATRRRHVGDEVHLRGLLEISNHCARECHYCGLRAANASLQRYRLSVAEAMDAARACVTLGYGTLVLQAGEDYGLTTRWIADLVALIKHETRLAVTLSLGERRYDELRIWRDAGADRYLLRFETSNERLFRQIHPSGALPRSSRIDQLATLRELGYEVGSGVMIGIPGQTYADLARDIELFGELDLDMIGVGPYIAHPDTPLGASGPSGDDEQVPASELMTYKVIALARLMRPDANIPATTALATLNSANGRELGLSRGANVIMPNVTPPEYRCRYEIYPGKACVHETAQQCGDCIAGRIAAMGRTVGVGAGSSPNYRKRRGELDESCVKEAG